MATEWQDDEAEIAGEFDGGCGLETKRRREPRVGKESTEMADEAAAAAAAAAADAIAGEESRSVCFDEEQGIWKCRHCSWTYQLHGPGIDLFQKHKSNYQLVMEFKILTRIKGTEKFRSHNAEKQLENGKPEVNYRLEHLQIIPVEDENQDPNSTKVGNKLNSHNAVGYSESITITLPDTQTQENNGIAKMAKHVAELDLEKVLEEQETHDLFCPNCHSCITKKVILRKRKRKLQSVQHEERPEKLRQVESITNIQETSYDNEPDIFKCLSCFSFFIPTENGFNIFRIFRKREVSVSLHDSNEQHPGQASSRDGNGFSSIFKAESNSNKANEAEVDSVIPIVTVGPSFSKPTSHEDPSIGISAPATTVLLPQGDVLIHLGNQISPEPLRGNEWEVMKSIVYGGLIESITSLGVVSSAAGAQTMTWNVVALGLANLIGGFFVILHDLSELKSSAVPNQKDEQDSRYWKVLGRKSNFSLHATVCIISYILFGLIPPVTYGFSFRKSDDKNYKLIAVAASSLLCIAFLAVGKGHVSEPKSYIKTFIYYIGLGFTSSGLSYVAGIMINGFLEQLGLFEHNAPVPPPPSIELFGASSVMTTWASH